MPKEQWSPYEGHEPLHCVHEPTVLCQFHCCVSMLGDSIATYHGTIISWHDWHEGWYSHTLIGPSKPQCCALISKRYVSWYSDLIGARYIPNVPIWLVWDTCPNAAL